MARRRQDASSPAVATPSKVRAREGRRCRAISESATERTAQGANPGHAVAMHKPPDTPPPWTDWGNSLRYCMIMVFRYVPGAVLVWRLSRGRG